MGTPLYAPITDHIDLITHSVNNLRQLIKGGAAAIELATAMIRYHNGICSDLDRPFGILHRHDPL